jgi:hypothetical protein
MLAALVSRFRRLHQSTFPGLQGAVDQNSRCVCQSIWKVVCKVATKHMYLIDYSLNEQLKGARSGNVHTLVTQ